MTSRLAVDRIACTGHGVCAQLLPRRISLDEWGYPVLVHAALDDVGPADRTGSAEVADAITLCPSRALYLAR